MIMDTTSTDGWVHEGYLARQLGVRREEMRALRAGLQVGPDWRVEKNRVEISATGVAKLRTALKLPPEAPATVQTTGTDAGMDSAPAQKSAPPTVKLCVWRTFPKNAHIIECYRSGTNPDKREDIVRVKVRDSSKFTRFDNTGRPLEIECRHIQADFFEHVGPTPKRKGRV